MNIDHRNLPPQNPEWSVGLFGACEIGLCCKTWFCPCITFGQIAEIVDEGAPSFWLQCLMYGAVAVFTGCPWVCSCANRTRMRKKFSLPDEPCPDCCVHFWCEPCALCQEYAELKHRGFDPAKGWTGPPTVPPSMPPSMSR